MDVRVSPKKLSGNIEAITSKSVAHRMLIAAAVANDTTKLIINNTNADITATIEALKQLGATITVENNIYTVSPIKNDAQKTLTIDCFESGSTFRFLLPLVCAKGFSALFQGGGRLPLRPIGELTDVLQNHGVSVGFKQEGKSLPLEVFGTLESGTFEIFGNISSQYITGLLFAASCLKGDSEIIVKGETQSESYINLTIDCLKQFNVDIIKTNGGYLVKGSQKFISPKEIKVEGDWSNAAFFVVGLLGNGEVLNIDQHSKQGDKRIAEIVKSYEQNDRTEFSFSAKDIPDLVPIMSVLACSKKAKTTITDCARLRLKESDRLSTTFEMITALSGDIKIDGDDIIINGNGTLSGGTVESHNDHRIAMAAAIASVIATDDIIIKDALAVEKSYPAFFEDFKKLGGQIEWLQA